ncbi:unnamed protein product [Adineta steineri]|uniref:VIT domain-containing protein n=1 Tax=Adineta steineri TaxID=433720 RepID=A0A818MSW9_9BILA|nr:unnamed protein product [Adineta steineri]
MLEVKNGLEKKHVSLKRVYVDAAIRSFAADVTITQIFQNLETKVTEAVYCFLNEEQAAVYTVRARINGGEIVAV